MQINWEFERFDERKCHGVHNVKSKNQIKAFIFMNEGRFLEKVWYCVGERV